MSHLKFLVFWKKTFLNKSGFYSDILKKSVSEKPPKISVLMTIYNHQNFLEQSIKSIIKQKFKNWELIACENGSKDESPKLLKNLRIEELKNIFLKKILEEPIA